MGKYFCIHNGKALDWRYERFGENRYKFLIGDIYLGQVSSSRFGWTAYASPYSNGRINLVGGFKLRHDACQYLIDLWRKHSNSESVIVDNVDLLKEIKDYLSVSGIIGTVDEEHNNELKMRLLDVLARL